MTQRNERDLRLDELVDEEESSESIISPLDEHIEDKADTDKRRALTFGPSSHRWRTDENSAQKGRGKKPKYSRNGASPDKENDLIEQDKPCGVTNDYLDSLGFEEGGERNDFLASFNGDHKYGVEIVRASFPIADSYGLREQREGKKNFSAIAQSVHEIGEFKTNLFLERVGIRNIPRIIEGYSALQINGNPTLVPKEGLDGIVSTVGKRRLNSPTGPALMRELGYDSMEIDRGPVLYYLKDVRPRWV